MLAAELEDLIFGTVLTNLKNHQLENNALTLLIYVTT